MIVNTPRMITDLLLLLALILLVVYLSNSISGDFFGPSVGVMAVIALAAFDFLNQSDHSSINIKTLENLANNTATFVGLLVWSNRVLLNNVLFPKKLSKSKVLPKHIHKAIDTHGKSLSRTNLSERDIKDLWAGKAAAVTISTLFTPIGYFALSHLYGVNGFIIHAAMVYASAIALYNRTDKLQKGHTGQENGYVFCDEPPAKAEKAKVNLSVFGGVKSPS